MATMLPAQVLLGETWDGPMGPGPPSPALLCTPTSGPLFFSPSPRFSPPTRTCLCFPHHLSTCQFKFFPSLPCSCSHPSPGVCLIHFSYELGRRKCIMDIGGARHGRAGRGQRRASVCARELHHIHLVHTPGPRQLISPPVSPTVLYCLLWSLWGSLRTPLFLCRWTVLIHWHSL